MKAACKKIWAYLSGVNGLLLFAYVMFVCITDAIVSVPFSFAYGAFTVLFFIVLSLSVGPAVLKFLGSRSIRCQAPKQPANPKKKALLSIAFYALPLCILMVYYLAWYPGGLSPDSIMQYGEAVNDRYTDWHPAIHTLLVFRLPLALTGGWIGSIVLFQILVFSAVLGYFFQTVYRHIGGRYTAIAMAFILLNPQLGQMAMYPWKDVAFAMGALLMLTYAFRICVTKGAWLKSPVNAVFFILVAALTTLFRHNAVLFTVPLLLAVLFYTTKKQGLLLVLGMIVLLAGIKLPLYSAFGVEDPDQRKVETLGLPMSLIGAAVTNTPELLDEDILDFAYQVAPKEVWEENYSYTGNNSVKWHSQTNNDVIEQYGTGQILSMLFRCIRSSKVETMKAFIHLTGQTYTMMKEYESTVFPNIIANEYGLSQNTNPFLVRLCSGYQSFIRKYLEYPYAHLGSLHLLLIASVLAKCRLTNRKSWKKLFFILPVFAYNYGTTLLLTGSEDSERFFFYTYLLMPLLLLFLYRDEENPVSAGQL